MIPICTRVLKGVACVLCLDPLLNDVPGDGHYFYIHNLPIQVTAMNAADDRGTEFASHLADVRRVPLADLHTNSHGAVSTAVHRVLREQSAHQVPVAAFNSSI